MSSKTKKANPARARKSTGGNRQPDRDARALKPVSRDSEQSCRLFDDEYDESMLICARNDFVVPASRAPPVKPKATSSRTRLVSTDAASSEDDDDVIQSSLVRNEPPPKANKGKAAARPASSGSRKLVGMPTPASSEEEDELQDDDEEGKPRRSRAHTAEELRNKPGRRFESAPTASDSEDEESVLRVSSESTSRSGHGGSYAFEVDNSIKLSVQHMDRDLKRVKAFSVPLVRNKKKIDVYFKRGMKIWILPNPADLPPATHDVPIEELDDHYWWVGVIEDCCHWDDGGKKPFGFLEVAWYYAGDDALDLTAKKHLHPEYRKKLTAHRFAEDERIESDHLDFVSLDAYAGLADGIETYLRLKGLKVTAKDRCRPIAQRAKRKDNDMVSITVNSSSCTFPQPLRSITQGWGTKRKGNITRTQKKATTTTSKRKRRNDDDDDEEEEAQDSGHEASRRSTRTIKRTR